MMLTMTPYILTTTIIIPIITLYNIHMMLLDVLVAKKQKRGWIMKRKINSRPSRPLPLPRPQALALHQISTAASLWAAAVTRLGEKELTKKKV
ncbi:hypothetical protein VZT92_007903 [Zoarces viviparus]|uniref:Uncharacterized protein n=1 Tax=Zoarces viviparus TaxID=48416 RepID=A0AAW1FLS4_ZOAVI